jgi:lysyl-tRNA synthetase class I
MDKQHQIATTNLTDVTKIPREIVYELFEASQNKKVINSKLPGFDFKDKTTIASGELLAYLRALLFETRLFTFTAEKERVSKLICKLHRYLN